MGKKSLFRITFYSALVLSFTHNAAAQIADSGEFTSLTELLTELLGINVSDPYGLAGILASTGVLWVGTYIALKTGFSKLDLEEHVLPSSSRHSGSRNIVAVLSLLVVLSMLGTGAFGTIVSSWQAFVGLSFGFGILVLIIYAVLAGPGAILGGGSYIAGKSAKATASGAREGAEALEEARQLIQGAEQEAEDAAETGDDAEARDAASKLERAIQDIERVIQEIRQIDQKDEQEIKDIINRAQAAQAGPGLGPEKDFENRLQAVSQALTLIQNVASSNGGAPTALSQVQAGTPFSDFTDLEDSVRTIYEDLEAFAEAESNAESTMEAELEELIDVVRDFENVRNLLGELESEIQEARRAENFEEELARQFGDDDLYEKIGVEESQVRQLGEELENLEQMHSNLESDIEDAINLLEQQLDFDESELEELERVRNNLLPDIRTKLQNSITAIQNNSSIDPSIPSTPQAGEMWSALQTIDPDKIENLMLQIEQRMQGQEGSLRRRLNDLINNFP